MNFLPRNSARTRRWSLACFSGLLLAALWLVHSGAFDASFYFDTVTHLKNKSNLHLVELSWQALSDAVRVDFGEAVYRPVSQLSLALTHYGFGLQPPPYRVGNLLIHWFASLAAAFLLHGVLQSPRVRAAHPELSRAALPVALLGALLWSLHPVQTNVVSYVIQRMASLAGLFSFLCVGAYLRARAGPAGWSWAWGFASFGSFALAVGSKENAVTLLPSVLLCEWILLVPPESKRTRALLRTGLSLAVLAPLIVLLVEHHAILRYFSYRQRSFTAIERLLTEGRIQLDYLALLVFPSPSRLILTPDVTVSRSLFDPPATAAAWALILGAAAFAAVWARRWPLASFWILWYLANQLAESTVLPLEFYFEHRLYVPALGLFALGAAAPWRAKRVGRPAAATAACAIALFLGAEAWATRERTLTWSDPVAFWADAAEKAPSSARNRTNLGQALMEAGRYGEAEEALRAALGLHDSKAWLVHLSLGLARYRQGDVAGAKSHLEESLKLVRRTNWHAPRQLAMLSIQEGRLDEARKYLDLALSQKLGDPETWRLLGVVHMERGEIREAEAALKRAVRYDAGYAEGWNTLGALFYKDGRRGEAEACFRRALSLEPHNSRYRSNLARARLAAGTMP